jgi:hypothetical protein
MGISTMPGTTPKIPSTVPFMTPLSNPEQEAAGYKSTDASGLQAHGRLNIEPWWRCALSIQEPGVFAVRFVSILNTKNNPRSVLSSLLLFWVKW